MATLFFSYSHADEDLRDRLEKQLAMLKRQGVIDTWHDRRIEAGENIDKAIDEHLSTDDIVLLLISPDFLASDYCYDVEMSKAILRHERDEAVVIPVILRPSDWHDTPFGRLNAVPRDGRPVSRAIDIDEALLQVAHAVREAAQRVARKKGPSVRSPVTIPAHSERQQAGPRSSNLRVAKTFTQRDKDIFRRNCFEFIMRFFENSLAEIGKRNHGIEGDYQKVSGDRFYATIYRNGDMAAQCTIYVGGEHWEANICYVNGHRSSSNAMNESVVVEADDQSLYLKPIGMASYGHGPGQKLSFEGAAEFFWEILMRPLQGERY